MSFENLTLDILKHVLIPFLDMDTIIDFSKYNNNVQKSCDAFICDKYGTFQKEEPRISKINGGCYINVDFKIKKYIFERLTGQKLPCKISAYGKKYKVSIGQRKRICNRYLFPKIQQEYANLREMYPQIFYHDFKTKLKFANNVIRKDYSGIPLIQHTYWDNKFSKKFCVEYYKNHPKNLLHFFLTYQIPRKEITDSDNESSNNENDDESDDESSESYVYI